MDWDWDDGPPQDTPGGAPRDDRRPPEEPPAGGAPDSPTFADAIEHFDRSAPSPEDDERTQLIKVPPDAGAAPPAGSSSPRRDLERPSPGAIETVRRGTAASAARAGAPTAYSAGPEPAVDRRPRPPRDRAARARRRKQVRRRRLVALAILIAIIVLIVVLVVRGCAGGAGGSAMAIGVLFTNRGRLAAAGRR